MGNRDIQAAWNYHNGTKHPGGHLMDAAHYYHPSLEPLPFKIYQDVETVSLPLDLGPIGMPALEAIAAEPIALNGEHVPDLAAISQILYYSAGITKKIEYPWGEMYFRAAACTGTLYHIEMYLICGDLPGLPAGVYHFEPQAQALAKLREGDYRRSLIQASGNEPAMQVAPAILVCTDVFWRNAVKYQAREYRHTFWDGGTLPSHTLAVCAAHNLPARIVMGFADAKVNALLGIDPEWEAAFALLPIGNTSMPVPKSPQQTPLELRVMPIGGREPVRFAPIHEMHAASSLENDEEAVAWRKQSLGAAITIPTLDHTSRDTSEVIRKRGSTRQFSLEPISLAQLSTMLVQSLHGILADFLEPFGSTLVTPYLIINAVDDLEAGTYVYHNHGLELLKSGDFRREAGQLALGQDLAADASINVYFLTDLAKVLERFGNRGYRAAQLEAAIAAGRLYLASYAQSLGASGLTFYDDAITRFFSPHAEGKIVMFLIVIGKKAKRR